MLQEPMAVLGLTLRLEHCRDHLRIRVGLVVAVAVTIWGSLLCTLVAKVRRQSLAVVQAIVASATSLAAAVITRMVWLGTCRTFPLSNSLMGRLGLEVGLNWARTALLWADHLMSQRCRPICLPF
jgi:hypothetical protein